jgi:hypothetical protein
LDAANTDLSWRSIVSFGFTEEFTGGFTEGFTEWDGAAQLKLETAKETVNKKANIRIF